jgi:GH24 family phage-related lysozyme (muramidase)
MDLKKRAAVVVAACAIAVPMEGLRTKAYKDPVGIPTICFGSTKGVQMGDVATVAQCEKMLTAEMLQSIDAVDRCVPNLPVNVLAAFADAAYNLGEKIACDPARSTAARKLKAGDYIGACNELLRWDKANMPGIGLVPLPGLTKRRQLERELCLRT